MTIIATLLRLAPAIVEGIARVVEAARRRPAPPPHAPPPWEAHGHSWQMLLADPPICAWCEQPQTAYNRSRPCPGPPPYP